MTSRDLDFLDAADVADPLLRSPAVAQQWEQPSALEDMTVGMLACHLARQLTRAASLLPAPAEEVETLPAAADHYRRAAWVTATDLDDPALDRSTDASEAALGRDAMLARWGSARDDVEALVGSGAVQDVVTIPWQGWSLQRADFLLTRLVEVVTHTDDLARSVGLPTPAFPDAVFTPVLHLLATLAAERHGQADLVSALTRRERMPSTISAF